MSQGGSSPPPSGRALLSNDDIQLLLAEEIDPLDVLAA